ncbi:hypothetical protein FRC08_017371 [Ceratobasidium sp. 394]|nr:hypothetical protein FRC08_017371 [Ceratobasidium sp. 394]
MEGNTRSKKYQKPAMKVTVTGGSTSTTEAHLNRVVHALPPKPVQPGRSGLMQPLQTQQRKSTQAVSTRQTPSNPSPRAHPKPIGPTRPQEQRKPAQVVRRQQRTPSAFLRLPADILAQIVPHLDPLDVVHLAWVNTSVRKILMHRSASPMWRACIGNTGLPACPSELSEPRHISVLYVSLCSSCGNREERKPDTYLFVRLCMPCRKNLLVDWSTIEPTKVRDLVLASDRSCTKNESYTDLKHSGQRPFTRAAIVWR